LSSLRVLGRNTAGVKLFNVAKGETIVSAVRLDEEEAEVADDQGEDATSSDAASVEGGQNGADAGGATDGNSDGETSE